MIPSPAMTGPLTMWMKAAIKVGILTACWTLGRVEKSGTKTGKRSICPIPSINPTKVVQPNRRSAQSLALSSAAIAAASSLLSSLLSLLLLLAAAAPRNAHSN
eukprot:CAMPEP_0170818918 /NCGR_PEP_ID=MMETSP0733-20121128/41088_1 /TAXON_ID=186038 /ORGANISM="Fragilariopsis kerguelensis, Strain L26-C5" /LENGTH=102 /DNA_ID=CAMNT_0011179255 /DNA_START=104 /DNA_END=412 /DNA_ORIENTATION=-